jgi:hypothetical protein
MSHPSRNSEPWAYAVTQPAGREFDFLIFPTRMDAESAIADEEDGDCEIVPLYPKSPASETPAQSRDDAAIGPRTLAAIAEGEALISPLDERARRFGQKRETYKEFATRIALLAVEELSVCKVHGA